MEYFSSYTDVTPEHPLAELAVLVEQVTAAR